MDDNAEIKLKLLELRDKQSHTYYLICSGLAGIAVFLWNRIVEMNAPESTKISNILFFILLILFTTFFIIRFWTENSVKYNILISKKAITHRDLSILNNDNLIEFSAFVVALLTIVLVLATIYGILSYNLALYQENHDQNARQILDMFFKLFSPDKTLTTLCVIVILIALFSYFARKRMEKHFYNTYQNILTSIHPFIDYDDKNNNAVCYNVKVESNDGSILYYNVEVSKNVNNNI